MNLLDLYLARLRLFLPRAERNDIVREIGEEIGQQLDDRKTELGRPPTVEEQAAVIRNYGHPLLTAARYRPQQHLIGPLVFPYYWLALKIVTAMALFGHAVTATVEVARTPSWDMVGVAIEDTVSNALAIMAWITLLAALADRWLARSAAFQQWDPLSLLRSPAGPPVARDLPVPKGPSAFSIVTMVVLGAWWLLALRYPALMFGQNAKVLDWGRDLDRLYPVLAAAQVMFIADQLTRVLQLSRPWLVNLLGVFAQLSRFAFAVVCLTGGREWVVWIGTENEPEQVVDFAGLNIPLLDFINGVFTVVFMALGALFVFSFARRLFKLVRPGPGHGMRVTPIALLVLAVTGQGVARAQTPDDAAIRAILAERIDGNRQSVGIVVGVVSPQGRRVISHGHYSLQDSRKVGPDTLFEIGSVTKIFTALLLADMALRKELNLNDPVRRFLPPDIAARADGLGETSLADLATHTAGFPFWPSGIAADAAGLDAMASYSVEQLLEFTATFRAPPRAEVRWNYSNTDMGLLGHVLARRAGMSYDTLLARRITRPLLMTNTSVSLSPAQQRQMAVGHDAQLTPAGPWRVPALAASGSLHSTARDLLTLLEAISKSGSILQKAMPTMLGTRRPSSGFQQALGWMVLDQGPGNGLLLHDGNTRGFASSIVYDPSSRTGVVVLSNSATSVSDIARHIVRPVLPLTAPLPPAPVKTEVAVPAALLDSYVGDYEPRPGVVFKVSRDGDGLALEIPGIPRLPLRAQSERDFFVPQNTRITVQFVIDEATKVTGLVLKSPTGDVPAARRK
jgi:D-alanyl-D-alanine-carboxypeptidase/D-alanyl-D-alanine-endopeptidase